MGLLDDAQEYARRSGRNLGGLLDWLGGGARAGAEPTMALMRGDALDQPLLPTADSGGRIGAVASAIGSTVMPVKAPAGALGAGPVMRGTNAALDMSPEARAARAAELGYTVDAYHGTDANFPAFGKSSDIGYHVGSTPEQAGMRTDTYGEVGGNIMPLKVRVENPVEMPDMGSWYPVNVARQLEKQRAAPRGFADKVWKTGGKPFDDSHATPEQMATMAAMIRGHLVAKGYDSVRYANAVEGPGSSYILFAPEQARSRFAAFDPARAGEANLLASRTPNPLGGLLSPPRTVDDLKDRL